MGWVGARSLAIELVREEFGLVKEYLGELSFDHVHHHGVDPLGVEHTRHADGAHRFDWQARLARANKHRAAFVADECLSKRFPAAAPLDLDEQPVQCFRFFALLGLRQGDERLHKVDHIQAPPPPGRGLKRCLEVEPATPCACLVYLQRVINIRLGDHELLADLAAHCSLGLRHSFVQRTGDGLARDVLAQRLDLARDVREIVA